MKDINLEKTSKHLVNFIRNAFQKESCTKGIIGLSGGVDSATSCTLAVRALGKDHVYPVLLPYGSLNETGKQNAFEVIRQLGIPKINVREVNIQPMTDVAVRVIESSMDNGRRGNIMARMRMVVLFDLAKAMPALVVGTENKTEHLLGYYTKYGDEASDIEPLQNFYKTEVYELARYLNVPQVVLDSPPTAGLWKGQTDEGEFGFSYQEVDRVLSFYFDKGMSKEAIIDQGFEKDRIERIWWWVEKGNFKNRLPYIFLGEKVLKSKKD